MPDFMMASARSCRYHGGGKGCASTAMAVMTDTITLAQLSDVPLAPLRGLALRHLNVKRGLGYLNWQRGRRHVHRRDALDLVVADLKAQRPDHIAVTGDLI